jgi:hypothetical protein
MKIDNNYMTVFPDLPLLNQGYWFRLILTDEENETTEIRYKMIVSFIEWQTPDLAFLRIDRSDVYINDRSPDLPVDRLAYEVGKVFYPLAVKVDSRMNGLCIGNQEQIAGRWEKIYPELKRYFFGEEADQYLNRMGEVLNSRSKLDEIFRNELFIQIYFFILYADYTSFSDISERIAFPVSNYGKVLFDVKSRLIKTGNNDLKEIIQEGTEVQRNDMQGSSSGDKNTYTANFKLDARTNIIREVLAEWNFRSPVQRKVRVILFPLRQSASTILFEEKENVQKKNESKGFFARLFGQE